MEITFEVARTIVGKSGTHNRCWTSRKKEPKPQQKMQPDEDDDNDENRE